MSIWKNTIERSNTTRKRIEDNILPIIDTHETLKFMGSVDTSDDLTLIKNIYTGQLVYVKDSGELFLYDGYSWVCLKYDCDIANC